MVSGMWSTMARCYAPLRTVASCMGVSLLLGFPDNASLLVCIHAGVRRALPRPAVCACGVLTACRCLHVTGAAVPPILVCVCPDCCRLLQRHFACVRGCVVCECTYHAPQGMSTISSRSSPAAEGVAVLLCDCPCRQPRPLLPPCFAPLHPACCPHKPGDSPRWA
jgi:hypothetical protein